MFQSQFRGLIVVAVAASLASSFTFAAEKKFASPVITQVVEGNLTPIELDIKGAKILALEVTDGGDGTSYDWADWIEPRLIGPSGEMKLTDLKWRKLEGSAKVGKNNGGGPLKVNGKSVAYGIGTHARSKILYDLPEGYTTFKAWGGLDNGGTDQAGSTTSVQFRVYTSTEAFFEEPLNLTVSEGFAVERILSAWSGIIRDWRTHSSNWATRLVIRVTLRAESGSVAC
ncbi:MAG: NPCBM/NEW2 domain-containing protein [Planctomycetales bacterium]|jgi:hypothetical protein